MNHLGRPSRVAVVFPVSPEKHRVNPSLGHQFTIKPNITIKTNHQIHLTSHLTNLHQPSPAEQQHQAGGTGLPAVTALLRRSETRSVQGASVVKDVLMMVNGGKWWVKVMVNGGKWWWKLMVNRWFMTQLWYPNRLNNGFCSGWIMVKVMVTEIVF